MSLTSAVKKQLARRRLQSELARNAGWIMVGNGAKLAIQSVYFITIARVLGPAGYGAFVAMTAAVAIISPFVGMGASNLLIKSVSRDRDTFAVWWGNGLIITIVSAALAIIVVISCGFMKPRGVTTSLFLLVAISDLLFQRVSDLASFAFGAFERFREGSMVMLLFNLFRLVGLLLLIVIVKKPTIGHWVYVYFIISLLVATFGFIQVSLRLGRPQSQVNLIGPGILEGIYFSAGQAAQTVYNDIDKTMLGRMADLGSVGIYGAAYRLIEVALVPIRSLVSAAYPGTFRAGQKGAAGSIEYMTRLLPRSALYAALASTVLFVCSPGVPLILGERYIRTAEALRWLSILPLLKTLQFFLADALTGCGYQSLRTLLQATLAAFNVLINLWLIRRYSWRGASWSSLVTDGLLTVCLAVAIFWIRAYQWKHDTRLNEAT